jgi:hypothetical protein
MFCKRTLIKDLNKCDSVFKDGVLKKILFFDIDFIQIVEQGTK